MIYAGLDVGSTYCKLLIIDNSKQIILQDIFKIMGDPEVIANRILRKAIKSLGIKKKNMKTIITGKNGENTIKFSKFISEFNCITEAALEFQPNVKIIIDSGGFTNKVIKIEGRKIMDFQTNDVCSSGSGIFIELILKSLDISFQDLSNLALKSKKSKKITSQCSIFAESEVIYLMNEGIPLEEIASGVCYSVVGRLIPLISKIGLEKPLIISGGVGKIPAIRLFLEKELGVQLGIYELDPQYFTAYGASLLALKDQKSKN